MHDHEQEMKSHLLSTLDIRVSTYIHRLALDPTSMQAPFYRWKESLAHIIFVCMRQIPRKSENSDTAIDHLWYNVNYPSFV